jgi:hypothetical protein
MGALLILAAVAVVAYAASLRVHPWTPCRRCGGGGKTWDRIWRGASGTCPACGGRGRKPRAGVRVLRPGRHKKLASGQPNHKNVDKRNN